MQQEENGEEEQDNMDYVPLEKYQRREYFSQIIHFQLNTIVFNSTEP